ncbi:MAG: glutaredoxin 3 [Candidatus Azotimanducaceae bacterium]|jgi:glutaredoxin 3
MFEKLKAWFGLTARDPHRLSGEPIAMETHEPNSPDSKAADSKAPDSQNPDSKSKPIVMYTTRFCPFCVRARSLLDSKGWVFEDISVDGNPGLREEMIRKAGRHTVPQIWIGEHHIGGCDELVQLEMTGQLDPIAFGEQ